VGTVKSGAASPSCRDIVSIGVGAGGGRGIAFVTGAGLRFGIAFLGAGFLAFFLTFFRVTFRTAFRARFIFFMERFFFMIFFFFAFFFLAMASSDVFCSAADIPPGFRICHLPYWDKRWLRQTSRSGYWKL